MSFLLRNWHAHGFEQVSCAHLDPLTKVMKRASILEALEDEVLKAARDETQLTLAVIDLDKFKSLNAEHGHKFGDQMLVHFASQLTQVTREGDLVGRYGGQEFIIVFPSCSIEMAEQVLDRLKNRLDEIRLSDEEGKQASLNFSAGVSCLRVGDRKYENVIARADRALTQVKLRGGNQVIVDGE